MSHLEQVEHYLIMHSGYLVQMGPNKFYYINNNK